MGLDILDLDNRVIDEDACREGDGQKADDVQRKAQQVHRKEGGQDRQGQGKGGDGRGAGRAQGQPDGGQHQKCAFQKRHAGAAQGGGDRVGLTVDQAGLVARMGGVEAGGGLGHSPEQGGQVGGAVGMDGQDHGGLAVQAGAAGLRGLCLCERGEFRQRDAAAIGQGDGQGAQVGSVCPLCDGQR